MFDKTKQNVLGKTSRIVEDTIFTGNIESTADIRIDGKLKGNISCGGKIIIGPQGEIIGDINCQNIDVEGKFKGKMEVKEMLFVKTTAQIVGEVSIAKLSVEPGALFEATCAMKNTSNTKNNEPAQTT
ncbi:polymer-forming cytoskeletal protein [Flavobacterium sp.]|uniref:bactofilin family protein n=1 Tax=Flavobacterium sp. TaxID=239 RepID=UPI003527A1E5